MEKQHIMTIIYGMNGYEDLSKNLRSLSTREDSSLSQFYPEKLNLLAETNAESS